MPKKSCPKSVPGLTNMPKNTKKVSPLVTFILLPGIGQTLFNIKFKWNIGFECPHPVVFSRFRILTICLIFNYYGNISKKTTMTFAFKILKQIPLHTCFILQPFYNMLHVASFSLLIITLYRSGAIQWKGIVDYKKSFGVLHDVRFASLKLFL